MLSGVGPAEHLAQHGIPLTLDLPGVGKYLKDHPIVETMYRIKSGSIEFIKPDTGFVNTVRASAAIGSWFITKSGPMSSNVRILLPILDGVPTSSALVFSKRCTVLPLSEFCSLISLDALVDIDIRVSCVPTVRRPHSVSEKQVSESNRGFVVGTWRTRYRDHMYACWSQEAW